MNTLSENVFTQLITETTRGKNIMDLVVVITNSYLVENLLVTDYSVVVITIA